MTTVAAIMFVALVLLAVMHAAWGFGARWPAQDERDLVALVVGRTGRTRMPTRSECLGAAAAIFAAGIVALAVADLIILPLPATLITMAAVFVTAVFAGRGIAAYLPAWRQRFSQEPFATLDQNWYAPLCLLFALAFAVLVAQRVGG